MSEFKVGDRVVVQGTQIAEIVAWDEDGNVFTYVVNDGGSANYTTAHISNSRIELLVDGLFSQDAEENLNGPVKDAKTISAPVEEPADTKRVTADE